MASSITNLPGELISTDYNLFPRYGWNVLKFYMNSDEDKRSDGMRHYNPMCAAFPTEVSCNVPNIGAAGGAQNHNGLCELTQNIINGKIYLVLWFWYAFLVPVSFIFGFYRLFTILCYTIRFNLLYKTICHKWDKDIRKCLHFVLAKCQLGDWFVLYQLCKNCNPYFFREFIKELARELKRKPKETKKTSKDSSNGAVALGLNRPRTVKGAFNPAMVNPANQQTEKPPQDGCCSTFLFSKCFSWMEAPHPRVQQQQQLANSNNQALSFEDRATSEDESGAEESDKEEEEEEEQSRASSPSGRNSHSTSIKIP